MINIKNVQVAGWEHAMRGMRQSFGSTRKGDTKKDKVGDKDFTLALRLAKSGPSHSKYLRFIQVWADITAPLYWWKQMDTYRFGKEQNSESTMHTITKRGAFHTEDFSTDGSDYTSAYLEGVIFSLNKLLNLYKDEEDKDFARKLFRATILNADQYQRYMSETSRNWDFSRLAYMDVVIMQIAIAEMLTFPNIPINVTINEYVDLAKVYSTSKSSGYINGMLDSIARYLINAGVLLKPIGEKPKKK